MLKDKIFEIIVNNHGKVIGCFLGLILAVIILIIGFFRTIFICLLILAGYYIGSKIDNRESLNEILDRILPPAKFR